MWCLLMFDVTAVYPKKNKEGVKVRSQERTKEQNLNPNAEFVIADMYQQSCHEWPMKKNQK